MIAAQICVTETMSSVAQDERISFVFDRQHIYESIMKRLYKAVFEISRADPRVDREPSFMDKSVTVCLDPADYLAFEVREYRTNKESKKAELGISILGDGNVVGFIYTREELNRFVSHLVTHDVVPGKKPVTVPVMRFTEKRFTNTTNILTG
jgi:hypothetical protein